MGESEGLCKVSTNKAGTHTPLYMSSYISQILILVKIKKIYIRSFPSKYRVFTVCKKTAYQISYIFQSIQLQDVDSQIAFVYIKKKRDSQIASLKNIKFDKFFFYHTKKVLHEVKWIKAVNPINSSIE